MSGEPDPTIRKFNPGLLQSDKEIKEQFVVRSHELGLVLEELRGNITSPSCQHILVVGPRGRGKTMLLARIAAELRIHGDFAGSLLPVRFMEESQEIFSLTDFWLETMFQLANEIDGDDAELAKELGDTRASLSLRWREQITEAQARAAVLNAADRLKTRLVLILENLQSLFRDAHDEFGWQLREVLQTESQIILLASATSRFRALDDVDEPFFEMFRIVGLEPLDTEECGRLWQVVSGRPATRREVRPLQILTGGNPRLLVMAAEFARHQSFRRLMSELVTVIDEHTEYFRGHLEILAKTERRVYVAIIDLWQPSSASEIAARARVDIRVASTMLGRLVERGAVIRQGRGRKRLYAAAEPLHSMYYKLRRERDKPAVVENLIRFMVACYEVGDLWELSGPLSVEVAESEALRRSFARALASRPPAGDGSVERTRNASALLNNGIAYMRRGDRAREIECYSELIERFDSLDELRSHVAIALSYKCMAQAESGLADEALSGCHRLERAIQSLSSDRKETGEEPWATWLRWRALAARSLALAVRSEHEASLQRFRAAYTAFPANNEVTIQEMLRLVVALVGAGAPPRELVDVLTGETCKSDGLFPLIVALHERAGSRVRAPREVEEVAADISRRFDEAAERIG